MGSIEEVTTVLFMFCKLMNGFVVAHDMDLTSISWLKYIFSFVNIMCVRASVCVYISNCYCRCAYAVCKVYLTYGMKSVKVPRPAVFY